MFWNMIESKFNAPHTLTNILAIVMGALGLALQIYVERKELKESYNEIKETSKKVKKKIKKENENNLFSYKQNGLEAYFSKPFLYYTVLFY